MKTILHVILFFSFFCYLIFRFRIFQFKPFAPWVSLVFYIGKVMVGLLVWTIYTFYYTDTKQNDIHKFFADAQVLHETAFKNSDAYIDLMIAGKTEETEAIPNLQHWERNFDEAPVNENRMVIRLNALLLWLSDGVYFVHVLFFCFIAYFAIVLLYNTLFGASSLGVATLGLATVIFPSILLWTSGVLKEPLLMLGLALLVVGLLKESNLAWRVVLILLGSILLLYTKFVVLLAVLPAALVYGVAQRWSTQRVISVYVLFYTAFVALAFLLVAVYPSLDWPKVLANKQANAIKEAVYFKAGSAIAMSSIEPTVWGVIKAIPMSIFNVLFRPFFWEVSNVLMLANALENSLLVLLAVYCVCWRDRLSSSTVNVIFFLLASVFTYYAVIGMVTPVLGNLVRYKAPLLPLLLAAIILMSKGIGEKYVPRVLLR
jgi:hypothetical protein